MAAGCTRQTCAPSSRPWQATQSAPQRYTDGSAIHVATKAGKAVRATKAPASSREISSGATAPIARSSRGPLTTARLPVDRTATSRPAWFAGRGTAVSRVATSAKRWTRLQFDGPAASEARTRA